MLSSKVQSRRARARYLAQSIQLEESDAPGVFSMVVFVSALLLSGGIAWAAATPIEEVAKSPGQVIPAGHRHLVQHLEGGIVQEISVRDGDRVGKGEVLVRLAPAVVKSEKTQAEARLADLEMQRERLNALRNGREPEFAAGGHKHGALAAKHLALYHAERESRASQLAVVDAQIRQRDAELDGNRHRARALERQYLLLVERREMFEKLKGSGRVAAAELLATRAQESEVHADFEQVRGNILVGERSVAEASERRNELVERFRAAALAEGARVEAEYLQAQESLRRTTDRMERLAVRAPVTGIVQGMKVNTVNQVIASGEVILEIVPVSDRMIVQSRISPSDVGHVRVGQRAKVAVDSFNVSQFGDIRGEVRHISPSTFLGDDGAPYYEVEIGLNKDHVGADPKHNKLMPGMTVQADVITGRKSILDYLMKPVYRGFNSAFTER
jgi:HlyD family type I secretion membrane fusion protein